MKRAKASKQLKPIGTNEYQAKLYGQLMDLVTSNKAFFHKDQHIEDMDQTFRIFSYRMASYSDFCLPGALECRGIMYQVSEAGEPLRLVSHPMEKFFSLNENPFTMNLDLTTVDLIEDKADGSLISTFLVGNQIKQELKLKSKASINSTQVVQATEWLNQAPNNKLKEEIFRLAHEMHCTVNMEYVGPNNRIVLGYTVEELRVLTVRRNTDGSYVDRDELPAWATEIRKHWTKRIDIPSHPESFVASIPDMQNVEGFVIRLRTGLRVKVKTDWYFALHRTKDSVNSPTMLFEAALEEGTDDLKSKFHEDPVALDRIMRMEDCVRSFYQQLENSVEAFYLANSGLGRKDFALLAKSSLGTSVLSLVMAKYTGRPVDYKRYMSYQSKDLVSKWGFSEASCSEDQ
mmetsp:Transcript_10940/g.24429  ORF Transcript_10940/g.24429 Transcript_10940/m.24429 type:complete len:402 (-) Transcript_10940:151-1356(-)|eukprot:CAMPEP_0168803484 /NCGR_PEP_ID=MMETSP0726-20121227/16_1 /TAXON_ID=265536 /ORGANISM="Amphiprora sp., Strain CCMP467" /LENGTH=401 /DNA_ID=CAMNT_0008855283 /DNA_START=31 /DNA_END=1236 /DNA_ORIENTATION=+